MRNTDEITRTRHDEIRSLVSFTDAETGGTLTHFETFQKLLEGSYVHGKDANGTTHRISLSGTTEYLEACSSNIIDSDSG